jgi:hypothetical protein
MMALDRPDTGVLESQRMAVSKGWAQLVPPPEAYRPVLSSRTPRPFRPMALIENLWRTSLLKYRTPAIEPVSKDAW